MIILSTTLYRYISCCHLKWVHGYYKYGLTYISLDWWPWLWQWDRRISLCIKMYKLYLIYQLGTCHWDRDSWCCCTSPGAAAEDAFCSSCRTRKTVPLIYQIFEIMLMRSTKSSSRVRRSHGLRRHRKNSLCPKVDESSARSLHALSYAIGTLPCGHTFVLDVYDFLCFVDAYVYMNSIGVLTC